MLVEYWLEDLSFVQAVLSSTGVVMLVWVLMATVASGETLTAATAWRLSCTRLT